MQAHTVSNEQIPACGETIHSPSKRLIKNPRRLSELAWFYASLGLSGDDTMDWILEQIYEGHTGVLIDYNGNAIDKSNWFVEELFGEEPRRWLNAFKLMADMPMQQRLHENCVNRVMAMYFARDIHLSRSA